MNIDVRNVDISEQLQRDPQATPYAVIKREVAENHLRTASLVPANRDPYEILQSPMDADPLQWSTDAGGSHVAVPLHPYLLQEGANMLARFGAQFGAMGGAVAAPKGALRIIILLSNVYARPDARPGYCVYAGLVIRT